MSQESQKAQWEDGAECHQDAKLVHRHGRIAEFQAPEADQWKRKQRRPRQSRRPDSFVNGIAFRQRLSDSFWLKFWLLPPMLVSGDAGGAQPQKRNEERQIRQAAPRIRALIDHQLMNQEPECEDGSRTCEMRVNPPPIPGGPRAQ